MKVSLKQRKLNDGMISLFLEYYLGYSKDAAGKIKHKRKQEFLNLVLYEKPKNQIQRDENKQTLKYSQMILTKRQSEINENKLEIFDNSKSSTNLIEFYESIMETKNSSYSNKRHWRNTILKLREYCDPDLTSFKAVDESFVEGFKNYLLNQSGLHSNTASGYFETFREGIKKAYKEGIIKENYSRNVTGIKKIESKREYLTVEEIQKLASTDCENEKFKRAFLFACLTGLRWCDISSLTWGNIQKDDVGYKMIFRQKKTSQLEYFYLSEQAFKLLGDSSEDNEARIFGGLKYTTDAYYKLQKWALRAGINKEITFHCSRHTFAIMLLNNGTDIYTVSKLLGHTSLKNTQIYAKIVDEKKREAVNRIPSFSI